VGEFKFSDNYSDLSQESGARAGFQFEFNCERCGDAWRSEFVPSKAGQAADWLGRASRKMLSSSWPSETRMKLTAA
jgi:hypothetical protein